ncbi:MAG: hypothetical protein KatS3mg033_0177 [Thermonema sp.]|nr:MAG: hypothetical protein KatS3mg033_0177 [Thermonema sp.]
MTMKKYMSVIGLLFLLLFGQTLFAQSRKEKKAAKSSRVSIIKKLLRITCRFMKAAINPKR